MCSVGAGRPPSIEQANLERFARLTLERRVADELFVDRVEVAEQHAHLVFADAELDVVVGRVVEAVDSEGGALLEFDVRVPDAFVRWLLPFGEQARIVEPADLASRLAAERERVRAVYC